MSDEDTNHFVIRCRGLPWSTTVDEIVNFFEDCVFQEGGESVHMTLTREGRPSGEAYIELATEEDLEKALLKDKQHMGKRYIEGKFIFKETYRKISSNHGTSIICFVLTCRDLTRFSPCLEV